MLHLTRIFSRPFGRRSRYDDISISIQEHVEERTDELIDEGMARELAEQTARREFGNVTLMRERSREVWQWTVVESILADVKLTFRRLKNAPGFALTVLLTVAIGIGANTAVFSVIDAVLLKPLPYPDSDQLVAVWLKAPGAAGLENFKSGLPLSSSMYFTFADHNRSFQSLGVWLRGTANVTGLAQPEEVHTGLISDGVLQTLEVPPMLGRWLTQADQDPRGGKAVMLSYGYWLRHFGGDRNVVGHTLDVDSQPRQIVGVMPRGFRLADKDFDLLVPLAFDRSHQILAGFSFYGIARLKPGITLAQADDDIARLVNVWMDSWSNGPGVDPYFYKTWKITPNIRFLKRQVIGNVDSALWVVMATVGLVMLIACMNVANLLLVRTEGRQQELSIRAALGAGRARIARELLIESVTLGLLGGLLAVGVAYAGLRLLATIGPASLPRLSEITLDARSLGFTLVLSVFSALLFGSVTTLKYVGAGAFASIPRTTRTVSVGRDQQRSRNLLVVAQVAMALVLLVSALLMIRTFAALRQVEPGFSDPEHLQTMRISIPGSLVANSEMVTRIQNEIAEQLAAIPGVSSVGFAAAAPMEGNEPDWNEVRVEGRSYAGQNVPLRLFNSVSPGYFQAAGTRFVAGRDLTWAEVYELRPVAIVSENFARETWGSASAAIGKRIVQLPGKPWNEVIGVVQDVRQNGVDENAPALVYWPVMKMNPYNPQPVVDASRSVTFAIRSNRAAEQTLLNEVQHAVWSVNSNLPLASVQTMEDIYGASLARTSFTLVMLAIAGSMALLLGVIGIYGVISYGVSQRTREIGIRLALGAQKGELKWMFVRSALMLTAFGVVIGLGTAGMLMRWMKSLLFGISPFDPITYVTVPLILTAAAALASYLPARRAASVDPVEALRTE